MMLYRPVGPQELALIENSGFRAFPPRLAEQPIFYPVLKFAYAEQIARDWNSTRADTDYRGFVAAFEVDDAYVARFERRVVGGAHHVELWVQAEDLAEFNNHIIGQIEVVARYEKGSRIPAGNFSE